ncbi:MAG: hypothetical protein ACOC55_04720 [Candidatus Natronoplasma sp.]
MIDQRSKIDEKKWDYLIVLDACRYDHFEKYYERYIEGKLRKARSPVECKDGVATSEWCKAVFTERYDDVIYVSTTPHVNSFSEVNGFRAKDHFWKVIDVWDSGWNDEMGTVLPEKVNEVVLETKKDFPDKRIIAHYMQPHFPYLSLDNPFNPKSKDPGAHDNLKRNLRNFFGSKVRRVLGGNLTRKIIRLLNLPPINPMEETLRREGKSGLIKAYDENLKIVLESLNKLSGEIKNEGKMCITADHGEYLGEDGFYGHSYLPQHPVLNEVPWLEMDLERDEQ